jgi:hypothetical protein
MRKADDRAKLSPLFVDTEFIPSAMHYFTPINRSISNIPFVLPYSDHSVLLDELQSKIEPSKILHQSKVGKSKLDSQGIHSVKDLKE